MPWKRRSWTGDAFCRQDADHNLMDICEQEIEFPWVPVPNNDELGADAAPFQPRCLLQEILFAHCPYFPQPRLRGNLLCRADWLCLRGIAGCECSIQPIREVCRLLKVQRLRTSQLRGAPHGAPVPVGTGTSEQILLATSRKPARQSTGGEKRRIRCRRCVIPAAILTPGAYLCSLSALVSLTHSRKFPEQIGLALYLSEESQASSATSCRSG